MSDTNTDPVQPHNNYMWVLCNATTKAQESSGLMLAADGQLADLLANQVTALGKNYTDPKHGPVDFQNLTQKNPDGTSKVPLSDLSSKDFTNAMQWANETDANNPTIKDKDGKPHQLTNGQYYWFYAGRSNPPDYETIVSGTGQEMGSLQSAYSAHTSLMQQGVNVINGASQASSQQASSDNSALQSLITLASAGNASAAYLANIEQQTM